MGLTLLQSVAHISSTISMGKKEQTKVGTEVGKRVKRNPAQISLKYGCVGFFFSTPFPTCPRSATVTSTRNHLQY